MPRLEPLPIDDVLDELDRALAASPSVVLRAPPGAGKTTRVPPWLLKRDGAGEGAVVVLEPRRIAARAAAARIAFEQGWTLGREVGYAVRFDRRSGADTRLLVVTEGLLGRMLQEDPFLERFDTVVFDEFHERSLASDLALAMVRRVQQELRPELRIVVMSATLETERLARFLGTGGPDGAPCPIVDSAGRTHPVSLEYVRDDGDRLERRVARACLRGLRDTDGDVLAFLPGKAEIRRAEGALAGAAADNGFAVLPLHGGLSAREQDAALRPGRGRRVVLATNVAETSVTVRGVTAVVDSGLVKTMRHDPGAGLDRLVAIRVSRSSADQRAGRAGRERPGHCIRLWSEAEQRGLRAVAEPEVRRVDLAGPALELIAWGERDPASFPWYEAPDAVALEKAHALLATLDAVDEHGLTPTGRRMAALPLPPRLSRVLLAAVDLGQRELGALAAAVLAEPDAVGRPEHAPTSDSDVLDMIDRVERAWREKHRGGGLKRLRAARDQLLRLAPSRGQGDAVRDRGEALGRALLAGYADRLARRRAPGSERAVMVGGGGVRLSERSAVRTAALFACVSLGAGRRGAHADALVHQASAVEPEWLPPDTVTEEVLVDWDGAAERAVATRCRLYRDLVLDRRPEPRPDPAATRDVLAAAAGADLSRALRLDTPELAALRGRAAFVARHRPELVIPALDDDALRNLLPELCEGRRSFGDLRALDVAQVLWDRLPWDVRAAIERDAPLRLTIPIGRAAPLDWSGDRPVLAARIQEMFGCAATPTVCGGRVPVLLHLLAPNGRPQQVTDDLGGFWQRTYAEVRKELRARYPKHAWPEDPLAAAPSRPGRRR